MVKIKMYYQEKCLRCYPDEPIHVDFLRVVPGVKIRIEVPVEFINHKSPGLKRGGVLNIVRKKLNPNVQGKIPEKVTIDLDGVDIGESFKISSIKLDTEVVPTIREETLLSQH